MGILLGITYALTFYATGFDCLSIYNLHGCILEFFPFTRLEKTLDAFCPFDCVIVRVRTWLLLVLFLVLIGRTILNPVWELSKGLIPDCLVASNLN